jgi:hypothetical protein
MLAGPEATRLTQAQRISKNRLAPRSATEQGEGRVGSVIKKRRKKMRKHKQRKLLKRQRHKK